MNKKQKISTKRPKKTKQHTVSTELGSVWKNLGISDPYNDESLSEYVWESASGFLREWCKNNDIEPEDVPDDVRNTIEEEINSNVTGDLWHHTNDTLLGAIERSAEESMRMARAEGAILDINIDQKNHPGTLDITIGEPFLKLWCDEVEGIGMAVWGEDESLRDIKSCNSIINILDHHAEVYGTKNIKRRFIDDLGDGWEPDTGSFWQLAQIAVKSLSEYEKKNGPLPRIG